MTALGVFRDDFYNAIAVLPGTQFNTTAQGTGTVLAASLISGAAECFVNSSGATSLTTDSAINIIAAVQIAVANAYKQGLGAFAAGVNPPPGVPNLFNVSWTLTILNTNAAALALVGGTGVTVTNGTVPLAGAIRTYAVTITSPTTVTIQGIYASATATFTV